MISSICVRQTWRLCHLWFLRAAVLVGVYIMVSFVPKPGWVCKTDPIKEKGASAMTPVSVEALDDNLLGRRTPAPGHEVIDPHIKRVLQLFPVYWDKKIQVDLESGNTEISQSFPSNISLVKVFHIQNFNFSHFGRAWINEIHEHELHSQHLGHGTKNQEFILKKLKHQKLPDCVRLKVPHGATATKICVHYPQDDNFISNRLRDKGIWELELVFQMDEFFRANPRSQLIDLGCNVGVFTLFAASIAKPVLAVDILPSNLALIQLSIAINDENMEQANDEDADELQQLLGYNKKSRPKYADLITTVHNAIYNKHVKMYVYLKEDLNLGGTEVKELNIEQENTQHVYPKDVIHTKGHSEERNPAERIPNLLESKSPVTSTNNTKIIVDAVCLDDLIPFVRANLSVFLKIDVEGSEPNIFLCASNFFMHVDIRVILMEILFHRYSDQGKVMASFLLRHNMVPSEDVNGRKLLDTNLNNMHKWPENMFWIKVR